jgi:hypothetical protein
MAEEYMLLIMEREADFENFTPEQEAELDQKHRDFATAITSSGGEILMSDPLDAPAPLSRFTPNANGEVLVTDGPFAETKEILLGYYKLRVRDDAHARELAALCPTAGYVDLMRIRTTPIS